MYTFTTSVYKSARRFCIPKDARHALELNDGDSVYLTIKTPAGNELWQGRKTLRSGPEIYGRDIAKALKPGAKLNVEASAPMRLYRTLSERASETLTEGARVSVFVNRFERNRKARGDCIKVFGTGCQVCGFDFEKCYGKIGKGFIHVHHLMPVSDIGKEYVVGPKNDLRPVCANCHEMLHRRRDGPISIEELQKIIASHKAKSV
jgi:bifunctional DNA-binding transcriptional regulator/antitoxin component of YhaV-PrlF toxin-antitoxin module